MATKNFYVKDGLKVKGNTLLNGATYSDTPLSKLHVKTAANGASANLNNVNGLIIENSGSSNSNYALKLATGAGNILSVTNAGRVGIGTITPNVSGLTVVGDISASGNIYGDIADLEFTDLTVTGDLSVTGDSYFAALSSSSIYNTGDIVTVGDVEADEFIGSLRGAVTFKAQAGEAISKGDVVYISGISGNTTVVSKADADDANKMPAFGIAQAAASLNTPVTIVNFGSITNINTSSFPEGTELFVGTTAGALVSAAPTGETSAIQKIAKVTRQDATVGSMTVMGAGRSNAVPNLNEGRLFVGNSSNQAVADGTIHVDIANSRVGIGTTNPVSVSQSPKLAVVHSGAGIATFDTSDANGGYITITDSNTPLAYLGSSAQLISSGGTTTDAALRSQGELIFATNGSSERMRIDSSGNVGIGGSPAAVTHGPHLDIVGNRGTLTVGLGYFEDNGTTNFLNGARPLAFGYSGSEYMRVHSNGNVGVGTASPNEKLTVSGNISASGTVYADAFSSVTGGDTIDFNDNLHLDGNLTVNGTISGNDVFTIGGGGTSGGGMKSVPTGATDIYGLKLSRSNTARSSADIWDASSDSIIIGTTDSDTTFTVTSGFVGIGITNPTHNLSVDGTVGGTLYSSSYIEFPASGGDAGNAIIKANDDVKIGFCQDFVVKQSGNVGIGITSPTRKLHIDGGSASSTSIYIDANSINGTDIEQSANDFRFQVRDNIPLLFFTNNLEKVRIAADGNVGIGTTNPSSKLHIVNSANSAFLVNTGAGTGYTYLRSTNTGGEFLLGINRSDGVLFSSGLAYATSLGTTGSTALQFHTNNNPRVTVDTSGNVGIGITDPDEKLEVDGNIKIGAGKFYRMAGDAFQIGIDGSAVGMRFYADSTERMTILSGGNVGIGTTEPGSTLDVNGTLKVQNNNASSNYMEFTAPGSWNVVGSRPVIKVGGTEKMRASANGVNIGGSTDATHTLDVDGAAHFSSDVTIGGTVLHCGDLTVNGDLTVQGTTTTLNTEVCTTSAMEITNAGTGPALVVNQTGSQPVIDFQDDGTSTFYIEDGGNVGIGTTNPSNKLQLDVGSCTFLGSGSNGLRICSGSRNTLLLRTGCDYSYAGIAGTGALLYSYDTLNFLADTNNPINFSTGGSTRMTVTSSGNIGIGTTSPGTAKLYVLGGSSSQTFSTGADELVVEGSDHAGISILAAAAKRAQLYFNTDAFLRWVDNDGVLSIDTSSSSSKIAIAPSGASVGIGTNDPTTKLHVAEVDDISILTLHRDGSNPSTSTVVGKIKFDQDFNSTQENWGCIQLATTSSNSVRTSLDFYVKSTSGNVLQGMTICGTNSGPLVGVNTSSPTQQLQVAGAIKSTSYFISETAANAAYFDQAGTDARITSKGADVDTLGGFKVLQQASDGIPNNTPIEVETDGDILLAQSSGNVGIGTTTPGSSLHIFKNATIGAIGSITTANAGLRIQDSSTNMYLDGNSIVMDTTGYITTTGSQDLGFGTNSTYRLWLDRNGEVGIGTTNPAAELHINDASGLAAIRLTGGAASADSFQIMQGVTGVTNAGFSIYDVEATYSRLVIDTNGKVGLGQSTPLTQLHVSSSQDSSLTLERLDTSVFGGNLIGSVYFRGGHSTIANVASIEVWAQESWANGDSPTYMSFYTTPDASTTKVEAMRIDMNGNVGIGITNPSQKLHVVGKALITDDIQLTGSNPRIDFNTNGASSLRFYDTTNTAERMRIDTDGRVGIGTTDFGTNNTGKLFVGGYCSNGSSAIAQFNGFIRADRVITHTAAGAAIAPNTDTCGTIGTSSARFANVYALCTTTGAVIESNLRSEGIDSCPQGSVVVWRAGKLQGTTQEYDYSVMGVTTPGTDSPIVMGAEPILVTGDIKEGDPIVTSSKLNHGMKGDRSCDLHGKVIAQALEDGSGESYIIQGMIRKF